MMWLTSGVTCGRKKFDLCGKCDGNWVERWLRMDSIRMSPQSERTVIWLLSEPSFAFCSP